MLEQMWHAWFAWYPVKIEKRFVWLRTIERRRYMCMDVERSEYREISNV
jgi:hypothetical protein